MSSINKISINDLTPEHLETFTQTLHNVVSSEPTQQALAQVVDGIPTRTDSNGWEFVKAGLKRKDDPSDESIKIVKAIQDSFKLDSLEVSADVVQAYQDTSIGSRDFKLRLLEMVAISFHNMVAHLFQSFESDPDAWPSRNRVPHPRESTWFYHSDYLDHDQYPLKVSDVVGYWAEKQVFGGTVLFDRGEIDDECRDAFIHPDDGYRIFKLSDDQLDQFASFGAKIGRIYQNSDSGCPIPFQAEKYTTRIEPEEAMAMHIYRHLYERKPKIEDNGRTQHKRRRLEDYPEFGDLLQQLDRSEQR
ncbi:hypothetical protein ANOM_006691 [Aspergillus nomiae NRRL 13137]|uniref:Uncharacterized protein n=1 Tax=Aspergillus nomiae NRRL (strain ATCC 15546 / NRRL 13137 / CBS 260.88 / M93) TaxID=1509407 RepID=A0A0L1IZ32_ASPN3|nr:uncharacterized protein ANOM_006691 [Aspergillus nomiae NRRL 13137]KNG84762.1 hypothetical protein ANOM_006691 [Aspergillus nomiae NRRL 13137]